MTVPDSPDFTPVASRRRIAGWTPARQAAFIAALADGHGVRDAAGSVGLSARSAYHLRRAADAAEFAEAWDIAIRMGATQLAETAHGRALHGERRTVFFGGKVIGERIVFDDRLLMRLLAHRDSTKRRKSVKR